MGDFLTSNGMKYKGCIGMEIPRDPIVVVMNRKKDESQYKEETLQLTEDTKDQRFCEPIWIFEKK